MSLVLAALLALSAAAQDFLAYETEEFAILYPRRDAKLLPPSALVPFSLEYRRRSFLRLETELLLQPIDLRDRDMAAILLEVQLERVRELVSGDNLASEIREEDGRVDLELVYRLPSRSGRRNEWDKVVETVTTVGTKLFRLTYWIPERELRRVEPVFREVVRSFEPRSPSPPSAETPASAGETERSPSSPEEWLERGRASYLRFSLQGAVEAIEAYERAAAAESAPAGAFAGLAEALGWKAYLEGGASAEAIEAMKRSADRARRLAPDLPQAHRALAFAAYHESRMVDMETAIAEAKRLAPEDPEALLLEALWYEFNPERARAIAGDAARRNPRLVGAWIVQARAARRQGDAPAAAAAWREAVAREPSLVQAYLELGEIAEDQGDLPGAIEAYRSALAIDSDRLAAQFRLAVLLRRAGRIDEAISAYARVLELDPRLPEALYNVALIYLQDRNLPDLAAQYFQNFLAVDPQNEKAPQVSRWLTANGYR